MKLDKEKIEKHLGVENFAGRRLTSGEFVSSAMALVLITPIAAKVGAEVLAVAVSLLSAAYVGARTLMKVNRQSMRTSSLRSSEFIAHLLAQAVVASLAYAGLAPNLSFALIMGNAAVFMLCRGLVKTQGLFKLHQQRVSI